MGFTDHRGIATDDEAGDASVGASRGELNCSYVNDEESRHRRWGWAARCARVGEEMRSSLRGRRLFTLFAFVNLVNYLDRGVSGDGRRRPLASIAHFLLIRL